PLISSLPAFALTLSWAVVTLVIGKPERFRGAPGALPAQSGRDRLRRGPRGLARSRRATSVSPDRRPSASWAGKTWGGSPSAHSCAACLAQHRRSGSSFSSLRSSRFAARRDSHSGSIFARTFGLRRRPRSPQRHLVVQSRVPAPPECPSHRNNRR